MSILKRCVSLLPVISIAIATAAAAKKEETQCVDVKIPSFNLIPDADCSISTSKLVKSKVPDQVFLKDLGVPAVESCFSIVDPATFQGVVDGLIVNPKPEGGDLPILVSGIAGLTLNSYPAEGAGPFAQSFTAVTLLDIMTGEGTELGPLVTRDAGTIFTDGSAAARLSVVKGQGIFKGATGYFDEFGQEFDPNLPAGAAGRLCGRGLADSLFPES